MSSNKSVEIVVACQEDLPAIRDLATSIWNAYYPAIISQAQIDYMLAIDYSIEKLQQDIEAGVQIDKLLVEGTMVGFAAYGPTEDPGIVKLHKIYVQPSEHGLGLGSRLLGRVETVCRQRNYKKIILQVNKGNQRAIAAYERNHYSRESLIVVDIGEGFVMDDYLMAKQLE
jgi:GNAT superfamily N-acetyltransferase